MPELRALLARVYTPEQIERWITGRRLLPGEVESECGVLRRWLRWRGVP